MRIPARQLDLYHGFDPHQFYVKAGPIAFVAGATVTIPGPPAGFARIFMSVQATPNSAALPLTAIESKYQPAGLRSGLASGGTAIPLSGGLGPSLLPGESLDVINGGATAGVIAYTYFDFPVASLVGVRTTLTFAAPTVIVPAPAAGHRRRFLTYLSVGGGFLAFAIRPTFAGWNNDTIAHTFNVFLNGALVGRSSSTGTQSTISPFTGIFIGDLTLLSSDGDLSLQLNEAVVTNPVNIFVVYIDELI